MIRIAVSQHLEWQRQHRRQQRQVGGYHRLNQQPTDDSRFKTIITAIMVDQQEDN